MGDIEVREEKHSAEVRADLSCARGGNISLILRNCNGLTVSSTLQIANDPKLIF